MKRNIRQSINNNLIRHKSEKRAHRVRVLSKLPGSIDGLKRLLYENEMQRAALEIRNEELQKALDNAFTAHPGRGLSRLDHGLAGDHVTDRSLYDSHIRIDLLLNNIDPIIYSLKLEDDPMKQKVEFVSSRSEQVLGYTPEEFAADPQLWFKIIHPDDLSLVKEITAHLLKTRQTQTRVYRMRHKLTGEYVWIEDQPHFLLDASEKIIGFFGSANDITRRRTTEEALRKSEIRFRSCFDLPISGIAITSVNTSWIEVNDHLCKMMGYQREELLCTTWVKLTHPDDLDDDRELFNRVVKGEIEGYSIDKRFICKNGTILWTSISVGSVRKESGEVDYFIVLLLDISERKQSEAKLKESEERYRSIFDNATIGIYRTSPDGRILLANQALVQMLGYDSFEELSELNLEKEGFNPNYQRVDFRERIEREGKIINNEFAWKRKDKSMIFIRESGIAYRDPEGNVLYYEGIVEDITQRKQDERKIKLLAHSMENINECVTITDKNDLIIYVNESLLKTYGYTKEELIGKHIGILRPAGNGIHSAGEGELKGEVLHRRKDGIIFPVLLSNSVIHDDHEMQIAMVGVTRDITELKNSREELIAARDKAEENDRLKSAFLNNMSHEIRTPMNAIIGFSDLMLDAREEERVLYAGIVQKSSKQLLMLIDDVIHLSRLQSEKLPVNLHEFKPADLVNDVYQMFNLPDFKKDLDLLICIPTSDKDITIRSDADKIRQVLTNLISNALKYTIKGSVKLGFELNNGDIEFFVSDTGIGIPENELQLIFDSFYRGKEAISFAIGGTGLGLNIAKKLVELLGGSISVKSAYEQGSRFYFTIPAH